ncbi:MAG: glutamine synthetase, partial [Chlorobi bacterium]|nr:glutamine synthetase [Chlorobiota bacterium]
LGELEFFLIGDPETDNFPMPKQKGYHASAPYSKSGAVLNDILNCVMTVCGNIKYAHSEVGYLDTIVSALPELNGKSAQQVELEFLPTPIEETGDILVLARWIIRNVAYEHGYTVTFVPKLEVGHAGNGMHVHMLLKKDGKNALVDAKGLLTDTAKKLIGGLCKYASSMNAFGNSVAASYLRLVPHQEAPTKVCWSAMNRSALIRVPLGWNGLDNIAMAVNPQQKDKLDFDSRQTVEIRSPDGSCNSHFLLAGITMAAEWGINNPEESLALAAKSHVEGNIHGKNSTATGLDELATSCHESADRLLEQRAIFERNGIFPSRAIDTIAQMLKDEDDKGLDARLMALPEKEKLEESRKIMHRDIHK